MLQNEFVAEFSNLNRVSGPGQFTRVLNFSTVRISGSFSTKNEANDGFGRLLNRTERGFHSDVKVVPTLQSNQMEPKHVDAVTKLSLSVSFARSCPLLFPFKLHISSSFQPGQDVMEFHVAEWELLST